MNSNTVVVIIGSYLVAPGVEVSHCPSYYAADHERLALTPGRYALRLSFEGGYVHPMPYWLLCKIDAVRIDGALYSGFGGVNFAKRALPSGEAVPYYIQCYRYQLQDMVDAKLVELMPGYEWALESLEWARSTNLTWEQVRELASKSKAQYFCACGRISSECDRSTLACLPPGEAHRPWYPAGSLGEEPPT